MSKKMFALNTVPGHSLSRRRPGGTPAAQRSGKISGKQENSVRTMQSLMGKLQTELAKPANALAAYSAIEAAGGTPPSSAEAISQASRTWGATSAGGTSGTLDGIWGGNTKRALEQIKSFAEQTNLQGISIHEGYGNKPYLEMKDADVVAAAENNITSLSKLFTLLGMETPPEVGGRGDVYESHLDVIPAAIDWSMVKLDTEPAGGKTVTVGDLSSLFNFFMMIDGIKFTNCRPLKDKDKKKETSLGRKRKYNPLTDTRASNDYEIKIVAKYILESTIFKLSQEAEPLPEPIKAEDSLPNEGEWFEIEEATSGGEMPGTHCVYTVDDFFKWFKMRSSYKLYEAAKEAQLEGDKKSLRDLKLAQGYSALVSRLNNHWNSVRDKIISEINDRGKADEPIVTLDMIQDAAGGSVDLARRRPGRGGYTVPGAEEEENVGVNYLETGPIQEFMSFEDILKDFPVRHEGRLRALSYNGQLPDINRNRFRGDWVTIARRYVAGDTETEQINNYLDWVRTLEMVLKEIFGEWRSRYRVPASLISRQDRELNSWLQLITGTKDYHRSTRANILSRIQGR